MRAICLQVPRRTSGSRWRSRLRHLPLDEVLKRWRAG